MEALVSQLRLAFIANFSLYLRYFECKDCMVLNVVEYSVKIRYSNPQLICKLIVLVRGIDRSYRVQRYTSLCRSFQKDERSKRFFFALFPFLTDTTKLDRGLQLKPFFLNCLKFNNVSVNLVSFGHGYISDSA